MQLSYKKYYLDRYKVVSDLIESNSSILDICCGDCKIYDFLKVKNVNYVGIDFNKAFVKAAQNKGIRAYRLDIIKDEIPKADIILMQASLYQFIPYHTEVINKLLNCAIKKLILCEPIKNHATSKIKIISKMAYLLNNPGNGIKPYRFNMQTLQKALQPFKKNIIKEFLTPYQIEYIVIMRKTY